MTDIPDKTRIILNNLAVGKLVKAKMYNNLLQKVDGGEILSKKDLEAFDALDKELRAIYTPEEITATAVSAEAPEDNSVSSRSQEGTRQSSQDASPPSRSDPSDVPDLLDSLLAVSDYLQKKGYKIRKSAIYNHKTAGKIRPNKEGKYPVADVDKYAQVHLKLADGSPSPGQLQDKAQKTKSDAETRERVARARNWELRTATLEQKLVPRDLLDKELAARAAIFRSDGETFFLSQALQMVKIVEGDTTKSPDLVDYCIGQFEIWLARYLQKENFNVDITAYEKIFEQAGKDETEDDVILNEGDAID